MDIELILSMYEDDYNPSSMVPRPRKMYAGGVATPKRGLVDGPGSYSKPQKIGGEALKAKNLAQRTEIDGWLNNWLDDNFKNYGVRNREKFLKDLKRDWKKAKKTEFKNNKLAQSGDLPTVTPKTTTGRVKPGDSGKVFKENKVFYKNFGEHLVAGNEIEKDRFYRRLFFAGQIETNPKLKKDIDNYFKTVTLNKGRRFGFTDAELKKAYEVMTSNPDVPFILSADSGIDTSMKKTLFGNRFKSYQPYRQKTAMSSLKYIENIKKLEKITGIAIRKEISKEHNALKKILDISTLPEELKYSVDHLYGISEAVKNPKDKKFAIQVADNLIGGTVFQNTNAGFGGYSVKRKSLINNINEGKNVTKSLARLNELTTEFYPQFKNLKQPYKIVDGKLTFAKGFKGETQGERFKSYFEQIDKTKQGKQLIKKEYGSLKNLLGKFEARGCGKAAGGRILFSNGSSGGTMTRCAQKGVQGFINDLKKGNYSKATKDILKGGSQFLKGALNPMDMLKLRNLVGPAALGFMAAYEGGAITNDVINKGTPLNEALADNWLTRSFLPYTQDYAKAKNLLETGKVPSNMKKYVKDVMTFNDALKDVRAMESNVESRIADLGGYGMIDGTSVYTQEQEDKDRENIMKKLSAITEEVATPGSAKALEMKSLQDESVATRRAKKEYKPFFGFDKLEDVRTQAPAPGIEDYMYVPEEVSKDLRPITYQDYERTELPDVERQYYEKKYNISPGSSLSDYSFPGSNTNALKELTNRYNISQASNYPGYYGTQEPDRFMEGGIASLNVKKK